MSAPERNTEPESLAESLGVRGSPCPIPFTHDRLREVHHWWHEMARTYHEPDEFRYDLGAFIQAARNVTFMLQKEQAVFSDFAWYGEWINKAKDDALLRWLVDARTDFVHRQALGPKSWLQMRCIDNPRQRHYAEDEDDDGSLIYKNFSLRVHTLLHCYRMADRSCARVYAALGNGGVVCRTPSGLRGNLRPSG